jgi:hypothetical protein
VAADAADSSLTDEERKNLLLGEGSRARLEAEEGERLSGLIRAEVAAEVKKLEGEGIVGLGDGPGEVWATVPSGGLTL